MRCPSSNDAIGYADIRETCALSILTAELSVDQYAAHRHEEDRSPGDNGSETILFSGTHIQVNNLPQTSG